MSRPKGKGQASRPRRGGGDQEELERVFEGRVRLDALLEQAGSLADTQDVVEAFGEAQKNGVPVGTVVDALFDEEPRFSSPRDARALYGNLFGLWDLLASGAKVDLTVPVQRVKAPRPPPPEPPEPFEGEAPDEAWVERAWRYLDEAPEKERRRLSDAFENRQDALVSWLDQGGLSDAAYGLAHEVLFEAFALLELGGRKVGQALPGGTADVPAALTARAEEHLFEAEQADPPLPEAELKAARQAVAAGLAALWAAARK